MTTSPTTSESREFEGDEVVASSVKITKAGDGLSDALEIDPLVFHRGEEVFFVLRGKVRHVAFPPKKKGDSRVVRQHIIDCEDVAIVPEEAVAQLLVDERDRVKRALDSLAEQLRTDDPEVHPFSPDPDDPKKCFECGQSAKKPFHRDADAT